MGRADEVWARLLELTQRPLGLITIEGESYRRRAAELTRKAARAASTS